MAMRKYSRQWRIQKQMALEKMGKEKNTMEQPEMKELAKITKDAEIGLTEIYHRAQRCTKSTLASIEDNEMLADALTGYTKLLHESNNKSVVAEALFSVAALHRKIESARSQLNQVVEASMVEPVRQHVKERISESLRAKRRYDRVRADYQTAVDALVKVRSKDKSSVKRVKELEEKKDTSEQLFENVSTEALGTMAETFKESEIKTMKAVIAFWEAHHAFFAAGYAATKELEPFVAKYREHLTREEESYEQMQASAAQGGPITLPNSMKRTQGKIFGVPLADVIEREQSRVPEFVRMTCAWIAENAPHVEGIFRISAMADTIKKNRDLVNAGRMPEYSMSDVHLATGLLKQFLRDMPEPLMTSALYTEFIEAHKIEDDAQRRAALEGALAKLPTPNRDCLKELFKLLYHCSKSQDVSKMGARNLSTVVAPNILYSDSVDPFAMVEAMADANAAVTTLIKDFPEYFPDALLAPLVEQGRIDELRAAVAADPLGIDLTECDADGRTLLHIAAAAGHLDIVKLLLNDVGKPLAIDAVDSSPKRSTAIMHAIEAQHRDVAVYLASRGADTRSIVDADGHCALDLAATVSREFYQQLSGPAAAPGSPSGATGGGAGWLTRTASSSGIGGSPSDKRRSPGGARSKRASMYSRRRPTTSLPTPPPPPPLASNDDAGALAAATSAPVTPVTPVLPASDDDDVDENNSGATADVPAEIAADVEAPSAMADAAAAVAVKIRAREEQREALKQEQELKEQRQREAAAAAAVAAEAREAAVIAAKVEAARKSVAEVKARNEAAAALAAAAAATDKAAADANVDVQSSSGGAAAASSSDFPMQPLYEAPTLPISMSDIDDMCASSEPPAPPYKQLALDDFSRSVMEFAEVSAVDSFGAAEVSALNDKVKLLAGAFKRTVSTVKEVASECRSEQKQALLMGGMALQERLRLLIQATRVANSAGADAPATARASLGDAVRAIVAELAKMMAVCDDVTRDSLIRNQQLLAENIRNILAALKQADVDAGTFAALVDSTASQTIVTSRLIRRRALELAEIDGSLYTLYDSCDALEQNMFELLGSAREQATTEPSERQIKDITQFARTVLVEFRQINSAATAKHPAEYFGALSDVDAASLFAQSVDRAADALRAISACDAPDAERIGAIVGCLEGACARLHSQSTSPATTSASDYVATVKRIVDATIEARNHIVKMTVELQDPLLQRHFAVIANSIDYHRANLALSVSSHIVNNIIGGADAGNAAAAAPSASGTADAVASRPLHTSASLKLLLSAHNQLLKTLATVLAYGDE
jgi:RhoGAP domain/BAR domain of APPL family/Ankyrin repeats (3 copies)